jgi:L-iditol 2-dehydrogenase
MTVGVLGCGPIGLLTLQVARAAGATHLVATDLPSVPHRLDAARSLGAQVFAADPRQAEVSEILAMTSHQGVDVAFEAAGDNAAVEAAIAAVKPGGKVILVGIPPEDRTTFTASTARRKGLTIKLVRRMKHTYPRAIRLVESRQVDVRSLVTSRFPLEKAADAFAVAQRRGGIKVVIG